MPKKTLRERAHEIYSSAIPMMHDTHGDADPLPLALQHQDAQTPRMQKLLKEIARSGKAAT